MIGIHKKERDVCLEQLQDCLCPDYGEDEEDEDEEEDEDDEDDEEDEEDEEDEDDEDDEDDEEDEEEVDASVHDQIVSGTT